MECERGFSYFRAENFWSSLVRKDKETYKKRTVLKERGQSSLNSSAVTSPGVALEETSRTEEHHCCMRTRSLQHKHRWRKSKRICHGLRRTVNALTDTWKWRGHSSFGGKGKRMHSQSYGFSSSHVRMWKVDNKKGWLSKNWCLWTVVLGKTLGSPLDSQEIKPVNPKGN